MKSRCAESDFEYGTVIQPPAAGGDRYASLIANAWVLNKNANEKEQAAGWKFMEFYLREDIQRILVEAEEAFPAHKEAAQLFADKDDKGAFLKALDYAQTLGENAVWAEWRNAFGTGFSEYLRGNFTLDELIDKADKDVQAVLDDFYKK